MILYLNTTYLNNIHFALIEAAPLKNGKGKITLKETKHELKYNEHHNTLGFISTFLKKAGIKKPETTINKIIVCSGPGSFTGTRVGVTIAQGLGYGWNIPVHAISVEQIPKNLKDLVTLKVGKKVAAQYNRPAV
jgi:tRNA A37 threonylcarbamoyladenosine modification protein TsaB